MSVIDVCLKVTMIIITASFICALMSFVFAVVFPLAGYIHDVVEDWLNNDVDYFKSKNKTGDGK